MERCLCQVYLACSLYPSPQNLCASFHQARGGLCFMKILNHLKLKKKCTAAVQNLSNVTVKTLFYF